MRKLKRTLLKTELVIKAMEAEATLTKRPVLSPHSLKGVER